MNITQQNMTKRKISEDEMVLEFLKAEIGSSRYSGKINQQLIEINSNLDLITQGDLNNDEQNALRKKLFKAYRDYDNEEGLFEGFPTDVEWFEEEISKEDLLNKVYYIDYDYWIELSKGSRLAKDAVANIKSDVQIFKQSNDGFIKASEEFRNGKKFSRLILVTDGKKIVVLEGHLRLTVYAMNSDLLPGFLTVIVGYSNNMTSWSCF